MQSAAVQCIIGKKGGSLLARLPICPLCHQIATRRFLAKYFSVAEAGILIVVINLLIYNRFALFCIRVPTKKGASEKAPLCG